MYSPRLTGSDFFGEYDTRVGVVAAGYSQDLPGYQQRAPDNQANNQRKDTIGIGEPIPKQWRQVIAQWRQVIAQCRQAIAPVVNQFFTTGFTPSPAKARRRR